MKTNKGTKRVPGRAVLLLAALLASTVLYAQSTPKINDHSKNKEVNMSTVEKNKEVVRKLYEESLNLRNMELLGDLISNDYTGIQGEKGAAAFQKPVASVIAALPDVQWKLMELMAEGDKVVVRWETQGTHSGPFLNFTATGKKIINEGIAIYTLKDRKVVNVQVLTDRLGFLQALGAVPYDLTLLAQTNTSKDQVIFMDRFFIPKKSVEEFTKRMDDNRGYIKTLPGFVKDEVYEQTDEQGNRILITVAVWSSQDYLDKAKAAVQQEYRRTGFDPEAFMQRLNITMERGIYSKREN